MKALLPAILAGCAVFNVSFAQDTTDLVTEEVVVTTNRFEEKPSDQPVNVQVIDAQRIRDSGARTLLELLGVEAGIYTRNNSGNPNRSIDMRGFGITGDQNTLILVDGQRISEYELATANLTGIPLASIERIEIVRGSGGAVLYGAGATGGTINIVTREPRANEKQAYLQGAAGDYGTTAVGAGGTLAGERIGLSIDVDQFDSDNYRDNNEVTQKNISVGAQYFGDRGPVALKFSRSEQDLRFPGERTEAQLSSDRRGTSTPDDYGSLDADRVVFTTTQTFGFGDLGLDVTHRERHSVGQFASFGGVIDTHGRVTGVSPRVRLPFQVLGRSNSLVVGLDWEDWDYDSTSAFPPFFSSNTVSTQQNRAIYFKDTLQVTQSTTLSIGGREQRSETTREDIGGFIPKQEQTNTLHAYDVALRQTLNDKLGVYARAGRSYRLGNVDDNVARATLLEPQTSKDQEIGADFAAGRANFRAVIFRMRLDDEIMFLPSAFFPPFGSNTNLPPTERKGFELDLGFAASESVSLRANYTITESRFREGTFAGVELAGKNVPLVPRHRANASVTWRPVDRASLAGRVSYVGEQYFDNDQSNTFGRKIPDYAVVDMVAAYDMGNWRLGATIYNLFNEKYFSYGIVNGTTFDAYPEAERSFLLSAEYRFGR